MTQTSLKRDSLTFLTTIMLFSHFEIIHESVLMLGKCEFIVFADDQQKKEILFKFQWFSFLRIESVISEEGGGGDTMWK